MLDRLERVPTSTLHHDKAVLETCVGEILATLEQGGEWARPYLDRYNADLDKIDAELWRRKGVGATPEDYSQTVMFPVYVQGTFEGAQRR